MNEYFEIAVWSTFVLFGLLYLWALAVTGAKRDAAERAAFDEYRRQADRAVAVRHTTGAAPPRTAAEACEPSGDPEVVPVRVRR